MLYALLTSPFLVLNCCLPCLFCSSAYSMMQINKTSPCDIMMRFTPYLLRITHALCNVLIRARLSIHMTVFSWVLSMLPFAILC